MEDQLGLILVTAPGMFNQIDVLSTPGAGLRQLDFPTDVQRMFADLFTCNGSHCQPRVASSPSPTAPKQSRVRTYGSDSEM